jgi:hypothetical protein
VQLVKVVKKTNSKIDQIKTLLSIYCLLSGIKLSQSELTLLSYFIVYGITEETKERVISTKILHENSVKNSMSSFLKKGLLERSPITKQYSLNPTINIKPDEAIGMLIKLDNS